jgi:hypothetical protein
MTLQQKQILRKSLLDLRSMTGAALLVTVKTSVKSYIFWFVVALCVLFAIILSNPTASMNEKSYVVFILLLSFFYSAKALGASGKLLLKRLGQSPSVQPLSVFGKITGFVFIGVFSLLPALVVFWLQHITWAVSRCGWSLLFGGALSGVLWTAKLGGHSRWRGFSSLVRSAWSNAASVSTGRSTSRAFAQASFAEQLSRIVASFAPR